MRNRLAEENTNTTNDEKFSIAKYLEEFDIKDIIDLKSGQTDYTYSVDHEKKVAYSMLNGFRKPLGEKDEENEYKELLSKLEGGSSLDR